MNKKLLLASLLLLLGGAIFYSSLPTFKDLGKAQLPPIISAPASHTECKADLDYPNSNGYTESYTRPNKCHQYMVFYNYGTYFATGNCGSSPWCNMRVRCPAGASYQTHNKGGGWHYGMSPNIDGKYDGPAHIFCVDANGNQVAPVYGESEQYPNHAHSTNQTKVSLHKVQVVDTGNVYYHTSRPDRLGLASGWVDCPGGAYGPYPGTTSSLDIDYGNFPNHFHCKNSSQNLLDGSEENDNPEALPVALTSQPAFDLVGSGFGTQADTLTPKDQMVDKNTNWGQTPLGTVRCVHTKSDKVYFSTNGNCPGASDFPIKPTFQFTLINAAGSVEAKNGAAATSKFKLENTGSQTAEFVLSCSASQYSGQYTPFEIKLFHPSLAILGSNVQNTLTYSINSQSYIEFGPFYEIYNTTPAGSFLGSCSVYPQNYQSDIKTLSDQVTITAPASNPTPPSDPALIGWWKFDGNGNNEVPGSPNASKVGNVSFYQSGGKIDGYAYIPSGSDYLEVPYNSIFDLPNSFSIEFWFMQTGEQAFLQDLVYKGNPPNDYNFRIFRQLWNQYNFGPIITGYTAANTGYWTQTSNPNQLSHNTWHHVAFVKDSTFRGYYLDGVLTHSDTTSPAARTPQTKIIIANSAVNTSIDNLKIYNRALSAQEVAQSAGVTLVVNPPNNPSPPATPSGPVNTGSGQVTTPAPLSGSGQTTPGQTSGATQTTSGQNQVLPNGNNPSSGSGAVSPNNIPGPVITPPAANNAVTPASPVASSPGNQLPANQPSFRQPAGENQAPWQKYQEYQPEKSYENTNFPAADEQKDEEITEEEVCGDSCDRFTSTYGEEALERIRSRGVQLEKTIDEIVERVTTKVMEETMKNLDYKVTQLMIKHFDKLGEQAEKILENNNKILARLSEMTEKVAAIKYEKEKTELEDLQKKFQAGVADESLGEEIATAWEKTSEVLADPEADKQEVKAHIEILNQLKEKADIAKYEKGLGYRDVAYIFDPEYDPEKQADLFWYNESVINLTQTGLVSGYEENGQKTYTFGPGNKLLRAEVLKVTLLLFGYPVSDALPDQSWEIPYVNVAKALELSLAEQDPLEPVTRGEMMNLIYELSLKKGILAEEKVFEPHLDVTAEDSYWPAFQSLFKRGIIRGQQGKYADLYGNLNRAEMAKIIDATSKEVNTDE